MRLLGDQAYVGNSELSSLSWR